MLRLQAICKHYGKRRVLDRLDLSVEPGAFVALLGRSGSGKSTLLNVISGIDSPDSGRVLIDAHDLSGMDEQQRTRFRRHHLGFVFQFFNLIPTLSVRENLLLPLELVGRADNGQAEAWLGRLGLDGRGDDFPEQLSGGEQQRLAIARALIHDPALLLADEPTGNLDAATGAEVLALLARLSREAGKTLLVATHSHELADAADRVVSLQDGRLL